MSFSFKSEFKLIHSGVLALIFLSSCNFGISQITSLKKLNLAPADGFPNPPLVLAYSISSSIRFEDEPLSPIAPTVSGSPTIFQISPTLPVGVSFNTSTGEITGNSSDASASTVYTITASNSAGSASAQVTLSFNPVFQVNSTNDDADLNPGDGICESHDVQCTLRAAIEESNALGGVSKVKLPNGTYTITNGELTSTNQLVIQGSSSTLTILDANNLSRILNSTGPALTVTNVRFFRGRTSAGSIQHGAALQYDRVAGQLRLENTEFLNNVNQGNSNSHGGSVYFNGDDIVIKDSNFESNSGVNFGTYGGAISIFSVTASIERSTIKLNTTRGSGGGVYMMTTGHVYIADTTFLSNSCGNDGVFDGGGAAVSWGGNYFRC